MGLSRFVGRVASRSTATPSSAQSVRSGSNDKNARFAGSNCGAEIRGGDCIAETRKLNGVQPLGYLAAVLTSIVNSHPNSQIDDLRLWPVPRRRAKGRGLRTPLWLDQPPCQQSPESPLSRGQGASVANVHVSVEEVPRTTTRLDQARIGRISLELPAQAQDQDIDTSIVDLFTTHTAREQKPFSG
ncbi:hypothetical protein A9K65_030410 [Mesorhizobium sp. WSM1497]|nr:hypothetical protein A9K65_030410 [Mesorhizobium sp. WSM1497]PBC13817.1 hypothetical protein CK225_24810 [Mesorhizobium loti]